MATRSASDHSSAGARPSRPARGPAPGAGVRLALVDLRPPAGGARQDALRPATAAHVVAVGSTAQDILEHADPASIDLVVCLCSRTQVETSALGQLAQLAGRFPTLLVADDRRAAAAVDATVAAVPATEPAGAVDTPVADVGQLSRRERETLMYIGRGFTHQQTATRMGISKATVDTYVVRVRTKLGLGNKAELASAALRFAWSRAG